MFRCVVVLVLCVLRNIFSFLHLPEGKSFYRGHFDGKHTSANQGTNDLGINNILRYLSHNGTKPASANQPSIRNILFS